MKSYLLVALFFCSYASHAMNWVKDGALSEEAVKALSLLGITLPKDLIEANDIFQKKYLTDYKKIEGGVPVVDLEGNEFSQETLEKFLNYTENFTANTVIDKDNLWGNIIKDSLKGDCKDTELQELCWKQNQIIYKDKNGNNPQGLKKLRNLTVTKSNYFKRAW